MSAEKKTVEQQSAKRLLQYFLAAIAYRTQKALRGAPESYAAF